MRGCGWPGAGRDTSASVPDAPAVGPEVAPAAFLSFRLPLRTDSANDCCSSPSVAEVATEKPALLPGDENLPRRRARRVLLDALLDALLLVWLRLLSVLLGAVLGGLLDLDLEGAT